MDTGCCALPVLKFSSKNVKTMCQHAKSGRHRKKVKLRGKDINQILAQHILGCLNIDQNVTSVDGVEKDSWCSGPVATAKVIFL